MTLNRRVFTATLAAGLASGLHGRASAASMAVVKAKNVVLAHGLYADGSSWLEVIAQLQERGLNVTSVQHPLTTLAEAVAACQKVLDRQDGPTVLAGHSFAGTIISEVGMHPNVSALVYVAARAPDAGEDHAGLARTFPTPPASAGVIYDGDEGRMSEEAFLRDFVPELSQARARALFAAQWPFQRGLLSDRTTQAAWRSKPSFFAVSTRDRVVDPGLQRFLAKRMGAKTLELDTGHVSLLTRPRAISDLILQAAGQT